MTTTPSTQTVPPAEVELPDAGPPERFLNRETSWLGFNARVLSMAERDGRPMLERLKFLAIYASNLDEFFMVRVAGLKRRQSTGLAVRSADGLSSREQLARIAAETVALTERADRCLFEQVLPALAAEGIRVRHWGELTETVRARLQGYFREHIFPVLTPLAVDPAHPFPYISGLSLNLAVLVKDPATGARHFARVKVPSNVDRFIRVELADGETTFVPLEDLIAAHLPQLFPGLEVLGHHVFRVTRNADLEVEEDRDEDLLKALERELARRRFGPAVRLEVATDIDPFVLDLLGRELGVGSSDVFRVDGLLDLSQLWEVYRGVDRPDLKEDPFVPVPHPRLVEGEGPVDFFAALREGDVLVQHPYQSFSTSVQRFVEQAAADPKVLAIKQTLYRTSGDSPIVDALIDAAQAGKQVVVLVEIKARFDEQANIGWARTLEQAGCHVVYGLVGLKTHCKLCLVVRQEEGQIRRYAHVGTGNYNPKTARLYEDIGLLTADPAIGADLTDLFNVLTGYSRQTSYRRLMVAPHSLRSSLVAKIDREAEHARAGRGGRVRIKCNSLVDEPIIDALYRASQAGAEVELVIRGICALRPGVPGLSENIRVRSIVGRFLEHSRVFTFAGDGRPEHWMGSSDMMHRNLDRRIEALVRVADPMASAQLERLFDLYMAPDSAAWELDQDGGWHLRDTDTDGTRLRDVQSVLARRTTAGSTEARR